MCCLLSVYVLPIETGWDPRLQCLYLDTPLLQQQHTKQLYGAKNNCVHAQLGQILDPKDTKRQKIQLPLLQSLELKQSVRSKILREPLAHHITQGVGKTPWTHPYSHRT